LIFIGCGSYNATLSPKNLNFRLSRKCWRKVTSSSTLCCAGW